MSNLYVMAKGRPKPPGRPGLLFVPQSLSALRHGIDRMADLVRPTLGPTPRYVAMSAMESGAPPEVLDDAAQILRRVVQIPDPYADMGAMLLRQAAWRTHEAVGDGSATAAVLMQAIVHRAAPHLAAGEDPAALVRGLERGLAAALLTLTEMGRSLGGASETSRIAESLCHDPELSALLGEVFEVVGPDGYVRLEEGYSRGVERQYLEGACWYEGYLSTAFVSDPVKQEAVLEDPAVLVSDLCLRTADQLIPLLDHLAATGLRTLLIIAREVSGSALRLLVTNHEVGALRLLAVGAPATGAHQTAILQDLAALTGARFISEASGDRAEVVTPDDLGRAGSVRANAAAFTILGGAGGPDLLTARLENVESLLVSAEDTAERERLRERLGRLKGGVAIVKVGGATMPEQEARKARAERAVKILRLALSGQVAPGGGSAYLSCRSRVLACDAPREERVGLGILSDALGEPFRAIAANAGYEPAAVAARIKGRPPGWTFDARVGREVDAWAAGILDPVPVLEAALTAAVSGGGSALTTGVLLHHRDPEVVLEP